VPSWDATSRKRQFETSVLRGFASLRASARGCWRQLPLFRKEAKAAIASDRRLGVMR